MIAVNQSAKQVTPSKEDYLKAIWKISEVREQSEASTGDLAEALQVSPPAVSRMMKQMEQQALVAHTPYYGVRLTEKGRRVATVVHLRLRVSCQMVIMAVLHGLCSRLKSIRLTAVKNVHPPISVSTR